MTLTVVHDLRDMQNENFHFLTKASCFFDDQGCGRTKTLFLTKLFVDQDEIKYAVLEVNLLNCSNLQNLCFHGECPEPCDLGNNAFNVSLCLNSYELLSFKFSLIGDSTDLYSLIQI